MTVPPIAETRAGRVQGRSAPGIELFAEVPYAAPPVGELRFKPPRPVVPWGGIRPADRWRYRAPQLPDAGHLRAPKKFTAMLGEPYAPALSEDSLTLNVWTPSSADGRRRPVLFFMHGGGYVFGQAGQPAFDGEAFAGEHDVVFVSVTHRLNAFGFLYLDQIAGAEYAGSGNAGLLDLVAALEWVRDNIAAFGGDPDNVTIAGESGGAAKVSLLMVMDAARGLFHRAVCESGFALSAGSAETANAYALAFIHELGGTDATVLFDATMEDMLAAESRVNPGLSSPLAIGPVVDGVVFTDQPRASWEAGHGSPVPLLAGWTLDEVALFSSEDIAADVPIPELFRAGQAEDIPAGFDPAAGGLAGVEARLGPGVSEVTAVRRSLFPGEPDAVLVRRLLSDIWFRRPLEQVALLRTLSGGATYLYRFEWASPVLRPLGAPHCAGIALFFGNDGLVAFSRDNEAAHELAGVMSAALASFMRYGDPAGAGQVAWPAYGETAREVMIFDDRVHIARDPEALLRVALDALDPVGIM
jgi:para-nitrobenzyl esterase